MSVHKRYIIIYTADHTNPVGMSVGFTKISGQSNVKRVLNNNH